MDETQARELICRTGLELLETGLVARTWGNVSCRTEQGSFLITPSGLDYLQTKPEDIVRVAMGSLEWEGARKPSSEKGIHAAAYECFPESLFVIHTHQTCASALGLAGFEALEITPEEREKLGGVALASYGLPGTKKLREAVRSAMETGAETVLMAHHGAVICGRDKQEAMERSALLEEVCRRSLKGGEVIVHRAPREKIDAVLVAVERALPYAGIAEGVAALAWAESASPLAAQLDDMAQMLGSRVDCAPLEAEAVLRVLKKRSAVLVPGAGAFVAAESADDREALIILVEKAAVSALHTKALGVKAKLGAIDTALMRFVYKNKYSKKKERVQ